MKNKKLLTLMASVIMGGTLLGGGLSLTACKKDDSEDTHQHSWSTTEYGHDENNHWRECTDEECDEVYQVEAHDFSNGDCVCGVKKPTENPDPDDLDKPDPDDPDPVKPPVQVEYDTVETSWNAAAAAEKYGADQTTKDITIGIFKFGEGVYFKEGGVNTQGRDITVVLNGVSNTISFNGEGQSSSKITQYTLFKDGADVTPSDWATESKAKREFAAAELEAGTYTIKTSAAALITDLKTTEKKQKGEATSIKAVTTNGAKTNYYAGETFSAEGLQVYLVYDNDREDLLTGGYTVDDKDVNMSAEGTYKVTVTYTEKNFTTTYEITVKAVATENALTLYTTKLDNQIPRSVQKVFKVGDTFNSENLTVYAKSADGDTQMLTGEQYSVALKEGQDMTTAGEKTAVVTTTFGATAEYKIYVLDLSAVDKTGGASVSVNKEATVGVEGNVVTVNTITDAVKVYELLALQSNVVKPINVADGEYYENVYINVPGVQLNGSDTKKVADGTVANGEDKNNGVVIWFDALAGAKDPVGLTYGTFGSASVYVGSGASNFVANNITFKNKYNTSALFNQSKEYLQTNFQNGNTQAVALRVDSERAEFYNCKMTGYHDTLFIYGGNHYYENCWIEGHTDYIFGCDSNAYFYQCKIFSLGDGIADNGGYVVANRPDEGKAEGTHICVFNACDFDGDEQVADGTIALGRAWGVNMKMAVVNSTISGKFSTAAHTAGTGKGQRYCSMGNPVNEPKPEYMMEYNNSGDGAITASIANTCTYLAEADAAQYAKENAKIKAILGFYPGEVDQTRIFDFATLENKGNTAYTAENPAKPFGEDALSIVGSFRQQNGAAIQIVVGSVITLHVQGEVKIDWWGGTLGDTNNGTITYAGGCATLTIKEDTTSAGHGSGGIYIKKITVDTAVIPEDTKYTVTFDTGEGGPTVNEQEVLPNGKAEEPTTPVLDGFTFEGWYKEEAYVTPFDFENDTITADTTLYAKWKNNNAETFTVTIKVWGQQFATVDVKDGETLTAKQLEEVMVAKGYADYSLVLFTDAELTTAFDGTVTESMDVYAGVLSKNVTKYTYQQNVDGNSAYFKFTNCAFTNASWLTYNQNSSIDMYVTAGTIISFGRSPYEAGVTVTVNGEEMPACGTGNTIVDVSYIAKEDGIVSIKASGSAYLRTITVTPFKLAKETVTYDWKGSENTKWESNACIDGASNDYIKFNKCYSNGAQYFYIPGGTAGANLQVMLPAGATLKLSGIYSSSSGGWGAAQIGETVYADGNVAHATVEYTNTGNTAELVTVTAASIGNSNAHVAIEKVEILVPKIYNVGDSVDFAGSGINLAAGNNSTQYQYMDITSGSGDKFQDNTSYLHAGAGSTISFKVAENITQANLKVVFVDHNGNANSYQAGTHFTVTVDEEQHVATITVNSRMYIKSMSLSSNS